MEACKDCRSVRQVIITETRFGQGDSSHVTYVKCEGGQGACNQLSDKFGGLGFFSDSDLRKAQEDWNRKNSNGWNGQR